MKPDSGINNRTLVEECIKGDRNALNMLYTRFAPKMLGVIRRYIQNPDDAEDILHDGFIVAYTRLSSLRDFNRIDVWLATIMKNLSLRFLNSQDMSAILHELPDVPDTPEIEDIIDIETLERLMLRLPDGYRKVFRLAVLENKTHKEIGKLLGIAPNSSSSQLFHARMMMRKLITDYKRDAGLLSGLILVATCSIPFMLRYNRNESPTASIKTPHHTTAPRMRFKTISNPPETSILPFTEIPDHSNQIAETLPADSVTNDTISLTPDIAAASVADTESPDSILNYYNELARTYLTDDIPFPPDNIYIRPTGWSISLGVNPGILNFKNTAGNSDDFADPGDHDPDKPTDDGTDDKDNPIKDMSLRHAPGKSIQDYSSLPHQNHLPISFSVALNRQLYRSIGIETGLTYTYLHTSFESRHSEGSGSESTCHWHYLGIPLKVNILTFSSKIVKGYAALGAQLDIPLYSRASVSNLGGDPTLYEGSFQSPVVWSVSASYGISLRLSKTIDIFAEPSLQYRFEHKAVVPNIWSDNPWGFSLPIGIRLNW